ncbi:MAG TPA: alpha/beta hydrolase [Candidatus Dormibacteraeota bacterium]|nr:alpha/beta hydrolase [Candidatus Dormibacteraeota bacterium]
MALREGYLKLGGLTLHHTWGGRGSPIVFIHGLGSSGYIEWRFNLGHFAARHRVFAPDLPGFGRSDKPASARYGIPYFARTIDRYMANRRLREATVVGTSMGGRVALELALAYPARVGHLVVVNSLGLGRPKIQPYYPMMLLPRLGETLLQGMRHGLRWAPSPVIRSLAARFTGAHGDLKQTMSDEYLDDLREMYAAEGYPAAYLASIRAIANPRSYLGGLDVSHRLEKIRAPVLFIWGADDPLFPLEQATRAHKLLKGSKLAVIEGAGHTPQAEKPEQFNRHLSAFLKE